MEPTADVRPLGLDAVAASAAVLVVAAALLLRLYEWCFGAVRRAPTGRAVVSELWVYPVKSCAGLSVERVRVTPLGPELDRRWLLLGERGTAIAARACPETVLVHPKLEWDGGEEAQARGDPPSRLRLASVRCPGGDLVVPASPPAGASAAAEARVLDDLVPVVAYTDPAVAEWLGRALGRPARLCAMDPAHGRPVPAGHERPGAPHTTLNDGFPWLLASEASREALAEACPRGDEAAGDQRRFRPNIVVGSQLPAAWEEDLWRDVRVGAVQFRNAKPCVRCVAVNACPDEGRRVPRGEPLQTLRRVRARPASLGEHDGDAWYGANLLHDGDAVGAVIEVGDPVECVRWTRGAGPGRWPRRREKAE